jgi:hypothetical protein
MEGLEFLPGEIDAFFYDTLTEMTVTVGKADSFIEDG